MRIAIGSDHAGYQLKHVIMDHLNRQGIVCDDLGTGNGIDSVSYVSYGASVARAVQKKKADLGIVICGTGRGALCCNEYMARMARQHNDANILALGARVLGASLALAIVDTFLAEPFESGGRHQVRVDEIAATEDRNFLP
jgi:ribose 5-phosphate isomerase B